MRGLQVRRPTLVDALILVGATACGIALVKDRSLTGNVLDGLWVWRSPRPDGWALQSIPYLFYGLAPLIAAWTLAVLILRVLRPRPSLRRVARQPGFVACLSVAACLAVEAPTFVILGSGSAPVFLSFFVMGIGWSVGTGWVVLLLGGRWRAERDWIDRVGRLLGVIWLIGPLMAFAAIQYR